jgi:arabinofuranosyltransferase
VLLALYFLLLIMTAWITDDSFIGWGTVDNFINGYGLRYNITERVQSYTSPLMMFLWIFVAIFVRSPYWSILFLNFLTSLVALFIFIRYICNTKHKKDCEKENIFAHQAILPVLILILSKSYIDYSTSGLENSLEYMVIALFSALYLNTEIWDFAQLRLIAIVASLVFLTRQDSILIVMPVLLYLFIFKRSISLPRAMLAGTIGVLPCIVWELFSIVYYGFPFPNTYYYKLASGVPQKEYWVHGIEYLVKSIAIDPIGMMAIVVAIITSIVLFMKKSNKKLVWLGIGALLYYIYILRIGGDFMAGRFYAVLVFLSAIILSYIEMEKKAMISIASIIAVYGISQPYSTLRVGQAAEKPIWIIGSTRYQEMVADEKQFYYPSTGLLNFSAEGTYETHRFFIEGNTLRGTPVLAGGADGIYRIVLPPTETHIFAGLTDALIARIPAVYKKHWRVGHFPKVLPDGYIETIQTGKNVIADTNLAHYYDVIQDIVRGPIFSVNRFRNIIKMNFGQYDYLIDTYKYRYPSLENPFITIGLNDLSLWRYPGTATDAEGVISLDWGTNLVIPLDSVKYNTQVEFSLDFDDTYEIAFMLGNELIAIRTREPTIGGGLRINVVELTKKELSHGYDKIIIMPIEAPVGANYLWGNQNYYGGDGVHSVGHVILK